MKSSCPNWKSKNGYTGRTFKGYPQHCSNYPLRERGLRGPHSSARQVTKTDDGMRHNNKSAFRRMMERFDTERGRHYHSKRLGIVEPVFGNTRATLGMDRFTLRGRTTVDAQWKLYCIVHNIGTLARYGPSFAGPPCEGSGSDQCRGSALTTRVALRDLKHPFVLYRYLGRIGGEHTISYRAFSTGSTQTSPPPSQERIADVPQRSEERTHSDEKASGECATLCGDR